MAAGCISKSQAISKPGTRRFAIKTTYGVAATLLLAGVSFVLTTSSGPSIVIGWALVIGGLSSLFMRLIEVQSVRFAGAESMLMAAAVGMLTWGLKWFVGTTAGEWDDAAAVLVAVAVAWGLDTLVGSGGSVTCFICKKPIEGAVSFSCPRCAQVTCARPECWIGRHLRCSSCDTREVVLFPDEERWWRPRVGPRLTNGACSVCFKEAHEKDLRACGQCPWPTCKRCWDLQNGRCVRCDWLMPDLPKALRPFLAEWRQNDHHHAEDAVRRRS